MGARLRIRLRPEGYRSPADKAQASMDQWASRKNEPHDQGRDCQTLLLRDPRPAASPPAELRRRLQLREAAQNPQGPHTIRIHLQSLDFKPTQIQNQPAPANAGTKHLVRPRPISQLRPRKLDQCENHSPSKRDPHIRRRSRKRPDGRRRDQNAGERISNAKPAPPAESKRRLGSAPRAENYSHRRRNPPRHTFRAPRPM